jgi:hypothetical protein
MQNTRPKKQSEILLHFIAKLLLELLVVRCLYIYIACVSMGSPEKNDLGNFQIFYLCPMVICEYIAKHFDLCPRFNTQIYDPYFFMVKNTYVEICVRVVLQLDF